MLLIFKTTRQGDEPWQSPEVSIKVSAPESPQVEPRSEFLRGTKHAWESEDQEENNILDRFLKVKKFADNRVASYESKHFNPKYLLSP